MADRMTDSPLRVLVVEDCPDARDTTALLLQAWGCDTSVAADGPAALGAVADHRPDVVLLDLGLPGMHGLEVARRLRRSAPGPDRPLLVSLSGYAGEADR